MKTLEKNKSIVVAIIIFVFAIILYQFFWQPSLPMLETDSRVENMGQDVVNTYNKLQKITFNQEIFSSTLYRGLSDFSVGLPTLPRGRTNPFGALGQN